MKKQTLQVINENGVKFNVRVVESGDRYGRNDKLVNESGKNLVEFYDSRYDHTELGQFVSRYYEETILETSAGLDLDSGSIAWELSEKNISEVKDWLEARKPMKLINTNIKVPKKYQAMLEEIDFEGSESGYWAYTKKGYYFEEMECHTAHEYTQKELLAVIRTIKPCDCENCK